MEIELRSVWDNCTECDTFTHCTTTPTSREQLCTEQLKCWLKYPCLRTYICVLALVSDSSFLSVQTLLWERKQKCRQEGETHLGLLAYSLNGCNGWTWASPKPKTSDSPVSVQEPRTWPIFLCCFRHSNGQLDWKWSKQTSNQCPYGSCFTWYKTMLSLSGTVKQKCRLGRFNDSTCWHCLKFL